MRLLFVHEKFGALGGAEANVLLTATELKRRGHEVGILHGALTGREEAVWNEAFAERHPLASARHAGIVRLALNAFQPDVIFLHKLGNVDVLSHLAACGVPVVRMVHDHDLYCLRGYKYNPLSRQICTRAASPYCVFPCGATIARDPDGSFPLKWVSYSAKQREIAVNREFQRLIVASEYMKQELVRNGFEPAHIEIHAPVPPPAAEAFQSSFDARNRIVFAGQVIRGKGVDVLLEALSRVRLPFECQIFGDGNHRARCEEYARELGLGDRVTFAGFVSQDRIAEAYRDTSVAVMSSLWPEPFGATGLEAMRCGLPVVAFNAGGIREWLIDGWNGCLIPWMDRERYATAIESLLGDKSLARRMGENGRQWVGERFGFPKYINGLEELFDRMRSRKATVRRPSPPCATAA